MTARVALLCHAPTDATRALRFPNDDGLDDLTRAQAARLRHHVIGPAVTGPEPACRETAQALGLHAEPDPTLRGLDCGAWRGRSFADIVATDPAGIASWLDNSGDSPHGGETVTHLIGRIGTWLDSRSGRVLAVIDPMVARAAAAHALGPAAFWRVDVAPLSLLRLSGHGNRWNLTGLGRAGEVGEAGE